MKEVTTKSTKGTDLSKAFLCLLCFLWLLLSFAQAQGTLTLDQVFAKMDVVAKSFESVQADFERTRVTVIVNDKDVGSGKFYYMRKGKEPRVKLDLTKGSGTPQHLLIDKGKLQIYMPNVNQVEQASLSEHQDLVEEFMSLGFGQTSLELKRNFDVSLAGEETLEGRKTAMLDLKPRKPGIKSFRLWIDQQKWIAYQVKVTENSGDYSVFKYSNSQVNADIPDSTFELKMPKNVNVLKL